MDVFHILKRVFYVKTKNIIYYLLSLLPSFLNGLLDSLQEIFVSIALWPFIQHNAGVSNVSTSIKNTAVPPIFLDEPPQRVQYWYITFPFL